MRFSIGEHKWLRLLLLALLAYLLLIPLWLYTLDSLAWLAAECANIVYRFFDPLISINGDGKVVRVFVTARADTLLAGKVNQSSLRMDSVSYGLPMLVALIAVTRADSWFAKAKAMAAGLAVMVLISVPVVMLWAKLASLQMEDEITQAATMHSGDRSNFFFYAFHGLAFSQPVVAVAVWLGLLTLGLFKSKPKSEEKPVIVARNAPCPCGSGRKFKRCCGRA